MFNFYDHGDLSVTDGSSINEGIGQVRITKNLEGFTPDFAWNIHDDEALPVVFDLLEHEGLCLGGSSGINVAGAIRLVSIERGFDPEQFVAMPFGGGGSLHTGALIKEVGLANALVPRYPGVTSALGCVIADMRHDFVHTLNDMVDSIDISSLDEEMVRTDTEGRRLLNESGVTLDELNTVFELDMSYLGQTHTVPVAIPVTVSNKTTGVTKETLRKAFETQYEKTYGRLLSGIGIRILNLRTSVIGKRPKFNLSLLAPEDGGSIEASRTGERDVFVDGEWHKAAIFDRLSLPIDAEIPGPALLEQPDTTIFIDPDLYGKVDRFGNIVISRKG